MPNTVPAEWQVQCRLVTASQQPPSPTQIGCDGTFVHLMSDDLTRDQLLTIAAGVRPAPGTSEI
jgi:hypothetical protein